MILGNISNIVSEGLIVVGQVIMIDFLNEEEDEDIREELGWTIICMFSLAIFMHLVVAIVLQMKELIQFVKILREKCRKKKIYSTQIILNKLKNKRYSLNPEILTHEMDKSEVLSSNSGEVGHNETVIEEEKVSLSKRKFK